MPLRLALAFPSIFGGALPDDPGGDTMWIDAARCNAKR